MLNRRSILRNFAAGAGGALASLGGSSSFAGPSVATTPGSLGVAPAIKRVIFFLQNQGFDPKTCVPKDLNGSGSLAGVKLPEPISPLEPFKDRLHILTGLHGTHTSPSHSAFFGALGGYRGGDGVPPSAATIDYELSRTLPETLLPHLCIGMDSMENMSAKPTIATLSASGAGQPIFMHSNPNHLYQLLYGGISSGDIRRQHEARANILNRVEHLAAEKARGLSASDSRRYGRYVSGFQEMNGLRERLDAVSGHLKKFAPQVDDRYTRPEFETDWHDCLLDLGLSAVTSGVTNTLTIGSGRGEIFGAWKGLGISEQGHNLGHMDQPDNPIWVGIRQYNCRMLARMVETLESTPEGSGSMMDNTLIVYTSNNADKQHTNGANWPVMLLGNPRGALTTGCLTHVENRRPINALYSTLLHLSGREVPHFNMTEQMAGQFDGGTGLLQDILA